MTARLSKIIMCLSLSLYAGLVAYDNIVDYATNYAFLQHVLSMDSTLPTTELRARAITEPSLWRAAYLVIMLGEAMTSLFFLLAAVSLWRARHAPSSAFNAAKRWTYAAATVGFAIWFFGFYVVGGEWFASWQTSHWNGEPPAFRPLMVILAVLIFVNQPDGEVIDGPK